jgi:hypothetical protein
MTLKQLPRRLEVAFQGNLIAGRWPANTLSLHAPTLVDVTCTRTLWVVEGPLSQGPGELVLEHTARSELALAQIRLETARTLWRAALDRQARENAGDSTTWRSAWLSWIGQLENEVTRIKQQPQPSPSPSSPILVASVVPGLRFDVPGAWNGPDTMFEPVVRCELLGEANRIEVRYASPGWRSWAMRALAALTLLALVAAGRRMRHAVWLRETLQRYPLLIIGTIGIVWWLFLAPSVAGLAILLVAALLALRG